jgi:hypothetical protein
MQQLESLCEPWMYVYIEQALFLYIVTNQHGGRKDNTIILTNGQLAISTTTGEAHGWQHHIGEKLA